MATRGIGALPTIAVRAIVLGAIAVAEVRAAAAEAVGAAIDA